MASVRFASSAKRYVGFDFGWEPEDGFESREDGAMAGENVWPRNLSPSDFKSPVLRY